MKNTTASLSQLAGMVAGELVGDPDLTISGVADIENARPGQITFIAKAKDSGMLADSQASAAIVPRTVNGVGKALIRVDDPYLAVAIIHRFLLEERFVGKGIHPTAHVGDGCRIPEAVTIAPLVVLGERVVVGERVRIGSGVVVGDNVEIGDDTVLHANVTILQGCRIGARVVIHSGAVIGSDGYGYATDREGRHVKRPQVGIVQIDDDVEIGANVCIDRATFGKTWIRRGAKLDNLVQIAHNVEVGEDSLLVAQVGIAGSSILGKGVVMGGQSALTGHITLGERVMVGAKSGVHNNQPDHAVVSGIPAIPHKKWLRATTAFAQLPELLRDVRELKKK